MVERSRRAALRRPLRRPGRPGRAVPAHAGGGCVRSLQARRDAGAERRAHDRRCGERPRAPWPAPTTSTRPCRPRCSSRTLRARRPGRSRWSTCCGHRRGARGRSLRDRKRRGGGRRPLPARRRQPREGDRRAGRVRQRLGQRREGVLLRACARARRRRVAGGLGRLPAGRRARRRLARQAGDEVLRRAPPRRCRSSRTCSPASPCSWRRRATARPSFGSTRSAVTASARARPSRPCSRTSSSSRSSGSGRGILDVDRYATELHDPEITEPAGAATCPAATTS